MKTEYWIFFPDVAAIRFWTSKSLFTFQSSKRIRETFLVWVLYNKSLAAICLLKKKSEAAVGTSHRICYRRWIAAIRKREWIRKQFVYLRWMKPGHSEKAGCAGDLRASRSASSLIPNSIFYFFIDTPWCQKNWGSVWNVNKQLFLFDTYSIYLTFHLLDFIDFYEYLLVLNLVQEQPKTDFSRVSWSGVKGESLKGSVEVFTLDTVLCLHTFYTTLP